MRHGVESQAGGLDHTVGSRAPGERVEPCGKLCEDEGLCDVVVTTGLEAREPVRKRIAGGEEENRDLDALRPERLAKVATVRIGEADIDNQEIGRVACDAAKDLDARRDRVRIEPFFAEPAIEQIPKLGVVLDDQDTRTGQCSRSIAPSGRRRTPMDATAPAPALPTTAARRSQAR